MISRLTLLRALALSTAAAALVLLVSGLMGATFARADALAAFRWHAAALLVFSLAATLWPRRALLIGLAAPVVILGVPIASALRGAPAPAPAFASLAGQEPREARRSLKLVTFNTWDEARNTDAIRDLLVKSDADVAVLVEVGPPKRAILEVLKPLYPYQVHCAAFWPCSMALVSKVPFEAHGAVMPSMTRPAAVWGRIAGEGGGLTIIGVHVHRPTRSARIHAQHMQGLAAMVLKAQGAVVVAGDFNTPDWAYAMRSLQKTAGLHSMKLMLPTWPAWPVSVPQFPIDHILVGDGVTLEHARTGPASGSDHLPVLGTLVLAKPLRPRAAGEPELTHAPSLNRPRL